MEIIKKLLNRKPNKIDDIVINKKGAIICNHKLVLTKFDNCFVNAAQNVL